MKLSELRDKYALESNEFILENSVKKKDNSIAVFTKALDNQIKLVEHDIDNSKENGKGKRWYKVENGKAASFLRYSVKKVTFHEAMLDEMGAHKISSGDLAGVLEFFNDVKSTLEAEPAFAAIIKKAADDMIEERKLTRQKNANDPEFAAKKARTAERAAERAAFTTNEN